MVEFTETSLDVNKPKPPLIEVKESNNTVPVTSMVVVSHSSVLFRLGIPVCETAELKVVTPEPVILMLLIEQFVVVGNVIAVEELL